MEMKVHLHPDVFEIVKNGVPCINLTENGCVLSEEERPSYGLLAKPTKIGDTLLFLKRPLEDECLKAQVTNLRYFKNFEEMGNSYEFKRLYLKNYNPEMWLKELSRFYTNEEIDKDGVVAIEFKLI